MPKIKAKLNKNRDARESPPMNNDNQTTTFERRTVIQEEQLESIPYASQTFDHALNDDGLVEETTEEERKILTNESVNLRIVTKKDLERD